MNHTAEEDVCGWVCHICLVWFTSFLLVTNQGRNKTELNYSQTKDDHRHFYKDIWLPFLYIYIYIIFIDNIG